MEIKVENYILSYQEGKYELKINDKVYKWDETFKPAIVLNNKREVLFESARQIETSIYKSYLGEGIRVKYRDLKGVNFAFDTLVWIAYASKEIYFEWIPVNDNGFDIESIKWPAPLCFNHSNSVIPYKLGKVLACDSKESYTHAFHTYEGSLDFVGQYNSEDGYILINETSHDSSYVYQEGKVHILWHPSLGKMNYKRVLRYVFMEEGNMHKICEYYKNYLYEKGIVYPRLQEVTDLKVLDYTSIHSKNVDGVLNAHGEKEKCICDSRVLLYLKQDAMKWMNYEGIEIKDFIEKGLKECSNPSHKMTRKQCIEEKIQVLRYLHAKNKKVVSKGFTQELLPYIDCIQFENDENSINLLEMVFNK